MSWAVEFTKRAATGHADRLGEGYPGVRPRQGDWPNYSKLADGTHHCHLDYSHVACWETKQEMIKLVEVYYVGSRKDAPYD